MTFPRLQRRNGAPGAAGAAAGLLSACLVLLLAWLASDPGAHAYLHRDCCGDAHHCVITDFAGGEGYYLAPRMPVRPAEAVLGTVPAAPAQSPRQTSGRALPPACGPPAPAARL